MFFFTLKFDFKLKKPEDFNIYNGIEWILVKNNLHTGTITKTLNIDKTPVGVPKGGRKDLIVDI